MSRPFGTGEHVLTLKTLRNLLGHVIGFDASCSCGTAKWARVPDRLTVRELHRRHLDEAVVAEQGGDE